MTVNPRCGMHIAHAFLELDIFSFFKSFVLKKKLFFFSVAALHCFLKTCVVNQRVSGFHCSIDTNMDGECLGLCMFHSGGY